VSQYGYGRRKELQVGEFLERRGFQWTRAPGSRGSIDLLAENGEIRCGIQIKATRKDLISYTRLTIDSERKLLAEAGKLGVKPLLALVSRNHVGFFVVPSGKLLLKGKLRPLQYEYDEK
jgi:Holliday junction resolvase